VGVVQAQAAGQVATTVQAVARGGPEVRRAADGDMLSPARRDALTRARPTRFRLPGETR
jgi:hypothetical protein